MAFDTSKYEATEEEAALFDVKPFDAETARKQMVERIAKTLRHANNEQKMREPDFERTYGNGILYRPTLNGQRIYLKGDREDVFKTTSGKFASLLTDFSAAVDTGKFDEQLKAALEAEKPEAGKAASNTSSGKGGAGKYRQSSLPERGDKIPHRVPADQAQPHDSYTLNKQKTLWRSPEQVAADDERSERRKATIAKNK